MKNYEIIYLVNALQGVDAPDMEPAFNYAISVNLSETTRVAENIKKAKNTINNLTARNNTVKQLIATNISPPNVPTLTLVPFSPMNILRPRDSNLTQALIVKAPANACPETVTSLAVPLLCKESSNKPYSLCKKPLIVPSSPLSCISSAAATANFSVANSRRVLNPLFEFVSVVKFIFVLLVKWFIKSIPSYNNFLVNFVLPGVYIIKQIYKMKFLNERNYTK